MHNHQFQHADYEITFLVVHYKIVTLVYSYMLYLKAAVFQFCTAATSLHQQVGRSSDVLKVVTDNRCLAATKTVSFATSRTTNSWR